MLRLLVALCALSACDLYFHHDHDPLPDAAVRPPFGDPDASVLCMGQPPPPGSAGTCECTDTIGWACNNCPFGEGSAAVACAQPGASCTLETWEHGCDCACNADGWWACSGETVGSTCPSPPPAPFGTCSSIEAEGLAGHAGWDVNYGPYQHGGASLVASAPDAALPVAFTGTGLVMLVETGPELGKFSVSVDDSFVIDFEANQPGSYTYQVPVVVATDLPSGSHIATVSCASPTCVVDYFDVICGP